jgi:DNA mismatch endonuclease, patch repair protein
MSAPNDYASLRRDPAVTASIMRSVKSKDTKPELALRRALHARGVRYRVHAKDVFGRPDIVIRSRKIAVFVDGDLWHCNPDEWKRRRRNSLAEMFPSRTDWWVAKIEGNAVRDRQVNAQLEAAGWRIVRVWESEIRADVSSCADRVANALREVS